MADLSPKTFAELRTILELEAFFCFLFFFSLLNKQMHQYDILAQLFSHTSQIFSTTVECSAKCVWLRHLLLTDFSVWHEQVDIWTTEVWSCCNMHQWITSSSTAVSFFLPPTLSLPFLPVLHLLNVFFILFCPFPVQLISSCSSQSFLSLCFPYTSFSFQSPTWLFSTLFYLSHFFLSLPCPFWLFPTPPILCQLFQVLAHSRLQFLNNPW